MDRNVFTQIVANLAVDYRAEMKREELESWWAEFREVDEAVFRQVLHNLANGVGRSEAARAFMPKKSEIAHELAMLSVRPPEVAWEEARKAIGAYDPKTGRTFGRGHQPTFHDAKIQYAVLAVGWNRMNDEEAKWVRKDFIPAYEKACELEFKGQLSSEGKFLTIDNLKLLAGS